MSADSSASNASQGRSFGQRLKQGFQSKVVVPVAVTIGTAAASYLVKKLPLLLEKKVLPKLKETEAPERLTNVVEQASAAMGGGSQDGQQGGSPDDTGSEQESGASAESRGGESDPGASAMSNEEREEQRRQREERRRERKRALQSVG